MAKQIHWLILALLFINIHGACAPTTEGANTPEKIIYLDWDENEVAQIFLTDIENSQPKQLTSSQTDVMDYALSPTQAQIAFVTRSESDGDVLWLMDWNGRNPSTPQQLLTCPTATCTPLIWHPDGQRLIYEKRPYATPNRPNLWWIDVQTNDTVTVLSDPTEISAGAAVSPNGQWLSYISAPSESIQFVNFDTSERFAIPSTLGSPAVWHPDSQQAIVRDLDLTIYHGGEGEAHDEHDHDFAEAIHLFSSSITSQQREVLDNTGNVDDSSAAYSPDGEWIAFGRKVARTNTGRQLWLMRQDGSEAKALTEDLMIQNGPPTWSENGRILLYQRADLSQTNPQPSVWQYNLETNQMKQITPSGWFPNWLR